MGWTKDITGVSSVIGTVLLLGITVTVFSGVSLVVLAQVSENADDLHADLSALEGDDAILLRHSGGESFLLSSARMLINVNGQEQEVPMSHFAAETADGTTLAIGDSVCISCLYPGQDIQGVVVIADNTAILFHGERGEPVGSALPDLMTSGVTMSPNDPWNGTTVTFNATVGNDGTAASLASFVRFLVDDVVVDSAVAPSLGVGEVASVTGSWIAPTGPHVLRVVADPDGLIVEEDEANNEAMLNFTVSAGTPDPGAPFEDTDGDGLYVSGTDFLLTVAEVADGIHDAGAHGLVIPASVGALSAATWDIQGNGSHRIFVDLSATAGNILIDAALDLHLEADLDATGDLQATAIGDAFLAGINLQAGGSLVANSFAADADLAGSTITAGGSLTVGSSGPGNVNVANALITGGGLTQVYANDAAVDATGAAIASTGHRAYVIGATITAPGLDLHGASWAYVYAVAGAADLTGASVFSDSDQAILIAAGDVTANDVDVVAPALSYIGSTGGSVLANDLTLAATGPSSAAYLVAAGGAVQAANLDADAEDSIYISGRDGATAQNGVLNAATGDIQIVAEADIDVQGTTLQAGSIALDADDDANEVFIQDACFLSAGGNPSAPAIAPSNVTVTGTPACGGPGVGDPGHAFEDTDGDGTYTDGVDQQITAAQLSSGSYDAGSNGLIIPESVGPINAGSIDFKAEGPSRIEVDLSATSGDIELDFDGTLDIDGTTLTTLTNNQDITVKHGALSAVGTIFDARGHLKLDGGDTDLTGATLTTLNNNRDIDVKGDDITAADATITSRGQLKFDATEGLDLDGATLTTLTNGEKMELKADDELGLEGATIEARGELKLEGDDVRLQDASIELLTNNDDMEVTADGWLHADAGTSITLRGDLDFDAAEIRVEGIQVEMLVNNKDLDWASLGTLDADGANIEMRGTAQFTAGGDIWFRSAFFNGLRDNKEAVWAGGDVHFEDSYVRNQDELISNTSGTVFGDATTQFLDDDDQMDVEPDGAHNNTPTGVWT